MHNNHKLAKIFIQNTWELKKKQTVAYAHKPDAHVFEQKDIQKETTKCQERH